MRTGSRGLTVLLFRVCSGYALMDKMKAKGTALEAEKEAALQRAQDETQRLRQEREESERLAAHKMATEVCFLRRRRRRRRRN